MNLKPRITNKVMTGLEYQAYHGNGFTKQTKYRAIPTEIDGHRFASKLESKRYLEFLAQTYPIIGFGDFGKDGPNELVVKNLVYTLSPKDYMGKPLQNKLRFEKV